MSTDQNSAPADDRARHWPLVVTIVLTWNNYEATRVAIQSLLRSTYPRQEVILVDNGSTDGSIDKLAWEFDALEIIRNPNNRGFARGCNVGARRALDRGADYILFLNNDCVVDSGFLEPAVIAAESSKRIGLVGGKMYADRSTGVLWYAGGKVDVFRGSVAVYGWHCVDQGEHDTARYITFVTGAMMLIKRRVLLDVGLLPEFYFFGGEEAEYSVTVRRAGFRLCYVPEFVAAHAGDGSHSNSDPKFIYNNIRSKLIKQQRLLSPAAWLVWLALYRLYVSTYAPTKLRRVHAASAPDVDMKDVLFAVHCAISDHAPLRLVREEDLYGFERRLEDTKSRCAPHPDGLKKRIRRLRAAVVRNRPSRTSGC